MAQRVDGFPVWFDINLSADDAQTWCVQAMPWLCVGYTCCLSVLMIRKPPAGSSACCARHGVAPKNNSLPPVNWRWVEEGDGDVGQLQPPGQPLGVVLPSGLQRLVPYSYRGVAPDAPRLAQLLACTAGRQLGDVCISSMHELNSKAC
jgi:hypothetical protein